MLCLLSKLIVCQCGFQFWMALLKPCQIVYITLHTTEQPSLHCAGLCTYIEQVLVLFLKVKCDVL